MPRSTNNWRCAISQTRNARIEKDVASNGVEFPVIAAVGFFKHTIGEPRCIRIIASNPVTPVQDTQ
jgi:hypothetical protein